MADQQAVRGAVAFDYPKLVAARTRHDIGDLQPVGRPRRRRHAPAGRVHPRTAVAGREGDQRGAESDHRVERARRQLGRGNRHSLDPEPISGGEPELPARDEREPVRAGWNGQPSRNGPGRLLPSPDVDAEIAGRRKRGGTRADGEGHGDENEDEHARRAPAARANRGECRRPRPGGGLSARLWQAAERCPQLLLKLGRHRSPRSRRAVPRARGQAGS